MPVTSPLGCAEKLLQPHPGPARTTASCCINRPKHVQAPAEFWTGLSTGMIITAVHADHLVRADGRLRGSGNLTAVLQER